ncbi:MAG TPA: TonB-dependent receptor [Bryobacteraceae bacterium]|nr:TonB-dependent receptor [Bryobacteraceae bacterium]
MKTGTFAAVATCAAFWICPVFGQMTITGSVSGSVVDQSGRSVPSAKIILVSEKTRDVREALTNEVGTFNLAAIQPDIYTLKVEHAGFKAFQRTGIVVSANEHIPLGQLALEVGSVSETVTVEAQAAHVETDTAEASAEVTQSQLGNLTARGRDYVSMLRTIPGVYYQADQDSVGGSYGTTSPAIRGASANLNILSVDGVVSNDMGTPSVFSSVTTMDAIGEVKIVLNAYRAEYAGNGGTVVTIVSKSGGSEYHGTGYYYLRNDALNANDFFNNRNSVKRPEYRYNTFGFSLGGPILIPKKFNADRKKLFGFYNFEQLVDRIPQGLTTYMMPTALERTGNFSQTVDTNNKLIPVNDPLNNKAPFPGNIIPANRLDPNGLALLKILPLPNFVNPAITGNTYNYQIQEVQIWPKRSQLFKIDYVPRDKDRIWVRGKEWLSTQQGYAVAAGAKPTGFFAQCYCFSEEGIATGWTHIVSSTIVNEFTAGVRRNHEGWKPYNDAITPTQQVPTAGNPLSTVLRSAIGYTASQWYPSSNPDGIIPRFSFGISNSPDVSFDDRFLKNGTDFTFSINDNLTWTRGAHTIKAGIDGYRIREYEGERSNFDGTFSFSKDTNNPLDGNWAFANAALGNFDSYSESNARYGANERQSIVEWFLQDTWKLTKRFTLDYGIRFTWANQMYPNDAGQQSVLALGLYNPAQAPVLYQPVLGPGNARMAQNPLTGALLPQAYVGFFVPGSGNPTNGGVTSGATNYPRGFVAQQPVHVGPRLGFAYDVFGNGKTAIRGGMAILYNPRISVWSPTTENPPAILTPTAYYGTIGTLLQTTGVLAPSNTNAFQLNAKTPRVYNGSFGIQQDLGHALLLDVSYATVLGRDLQQSYNINVVPYGSEFTHTDPTNGKPLADNFFRPYPGYGNITYYANTFTSNYHGLLVALNRRFAKGLQFGVSYAFSKFMDQTSGNTGLPVYQPLRQWSYGVDPADETHIMTINFTYNLPAASKLVHNVAVRYAFDNWILSGVTQFATGQPVAVTFTTTDGTNLNGGGDAQRIDVVGNAYTGAIHTFSQWFNTAAFARPGTNDPGNAGKYDVRNPGVNNFDLALAKNFPVKNEKRYFELRWEAYNAFNHTQYAGLNTTARFDPTGLQTNALFGTVTSTRTPRVMQGSLRFTF